jgi:hypothetical protein
MTRQYDGYDGKMAQTLELLPLSGGSMTAILEQSLAWHNNGIATIPILARSKSPALDSWSEYQGRLPTERELRAWFSNPGYNLAVITGWTGLCVVDWDDLGGYKQWMAKLPDAERRLALYTYRVCTSRGIHFYFYSKTPAHNAHLEGVDIKAAGGYVLSPPSIHPSGTQYRALGEIADIVTIEDVADLLPGYAEAAQPPNPIVAVDDDPFTAAMRRSTPPNSIESIKARLTIADVLGRQSTGRTWHTICPLHGDTNPSFVVYPDNHFYCYGCGAHGDVIDLYSALHRVSKAAAIEALA